MKILVITECYPSQKQPQYSVFIKQQLDELRKLGCRADVLVPIKGEKHGEVKKIEDAVEVRYILPYCIDRYELFMRYTGEKICGKVNELLKTQNYELIAVHITSDTILEAALLLGTKWNIPVVQHYHGLNVWKNYIVKHPYREEWYAKRRKKIMLKCSAVIGVSNKVSNVIRERIQSVPVHTVYNGVDLQMFYPVDCLTDTSKRLKIITVANLIPIKGLDYLIAAFARVYQKYPAATLDIIGQGILEEKLKAQAEELHISHAVNFLGRQDYSDVAKYMRESDIFVLSSFYEAIGCVYLEAMGCGLPIVGTRSMGIAELIQDGENGMLAEEKNVDSIFEKIMYLADHPEIAKNIGKAGRITVQKYTWEASAKSLNKIYQSLIEEVK